MNVDTRTYRMVEIDPSDQAVLDAHYEIVVAAKAHDVPRWPRVCRYRHDATFRVPQYAFRVQRWLAYRGDRPVGFGSLELPILDNLENAWFEVFVHPDHRRQGAGRAIYDHVVAYARKAGRTQLMVETFESLPDGHRCDDAGSAFARRVGMADALREARRGLDLSTVDVAGYDRPLADAWRHADGYSLVQWRDRTPAAYQADVAYLGGRLMSDAPMGDLAWAPENIDVERLRRSEENRLAYGDRSYHSAIRHDASGRIVGLTALAMVQTVPEHAWQQITLVDPEHRGHRLGTIVKIANLRYAMAAEPALRTITTWNAAVNDHMISINEAIGFRPLDTLVNWQQTI